jgi:hypothetical protein
MDQWYREDGADGFNIMASEYPCDFTDFVNLVMPELQRRSVVRDWYRGRTLLENMGLHRPEHPARTYSGAVSTKQIKKSKTKQTSQGSASHETV